MAMTNAAMAAAIGKSTALVSNYRREGMPMNSPKAALSWMQKNKRARAADSVPVEAGPDEVDGVPTVKPSGYMDARTARERAEAEAAQIRVLEARQVLVRRDVVRQEVARRLAGLRDSLLQIPARLQSVLAAESDELKVHDLLQDELYQALNSVAEVD
jgi:hypothetical protein